MAHRLCLLSLRLVFILGRLLGDREENLPDMPRLADAELIDIRLVVANDFLLAHRKKKIHLAAFNFTGKKRLAHFVPEGLDGASPKAEGPRKLFYGDSIFIEHRLHGGLKFLVAHSDAGRLRSLQNKLLLDKQIEGRQLKLPAAVFEILALKTFLEFRHFSLDEILKLAEGDDLFVDFRNDSLDGDGLGIRWRSRRRQIQCQKDD